MRNWQIFINYNTTTVTKEEMLNWQYLIISFVNKFINRCEIGHITLNAQNTNAIHSEVQYNTVQQSSVQYNIV